LGGAAGEHAGEETAEIAWGELGAVWKEAVEIARGELWEGARRVQREKPLETSCGELR